MGKGSRNRERDQKDLWNENRTLRRQIKSLQREVNALRKELGKAESYNVVLEEPEEDSELKAVKQEKPKCKNCNSKDITQIPVNIGKRKVTYLICQDCGLKTKVPNT